jgi:nitrous oxide reductase accessory protein NosL
MRRGSPNIGIDRSLHLSLPHPILGICVALLAALACEPKPGDPLPVKATWGYCPVCNMKVNASDEWVSEILYTDGTKLMFESPADMLSFYTEPNQYRVTDAQRDRSKIREILVRDYQSRAAIDATTAILVYKSRLAGPMGADVFAFREPSQVAQFLEANGGREVSLDAVTPEMMKNLRK